MFGLSKFACGGALLKDTPLIAKISEYIDRNKLGFHTPGHQQGRGMAASLKRILGSRFLKGDLSEVPGLDNLRNPQECLRETQGLAAAVFGARKTFFLVNGSTVGIEAAILGLNRKGGRVLVSRNAHISVVNGLILSGGQPVLLPAAVLPRWGIALGLDLPAARQAVANNPGAELAVLTQPSYQGIGLDPAELKKLMGTSRTPVLCDEAHGAHLFFQNKVTLSAQQEKLDVVVQSTHKTLGALTQASMLHINRAELIEPIQEALETLQTTSPSYLLLASLDAVQAQLSQEGEKLLVKRWALAEELSAGIRALGGYRLLADELPAGWQQDPGKIALSAVDLGLTGWELGQILTDKYGIIIELSDYYYCLLLLTQGHSSRDLQRLLATLAEIGRFYRRTPCQPLELPAELFQSPGEVIHGPRQVYQEPKERVERAAAKGRLAGTALTVYPPGIPLVWPGQVINAEQLDYLELAVRQGLPVHGLDSEGRILVTRME